jgi:hypothetical protein
MKIQKAFQIRAMWLVGLSAALLLAAPTRAQQEMDPTTFDINPGTSPKQQVSVRTAREFNVAQTQEMLAQSATALPDSSNAVIDASLVRITATDVAVVVILFGGVCLIALYAMAATRRERQPRGLAGIAYSPTHGATVR